MRKGILILAMSLVASTGPAVAAEKLGKAERAAIAATPDQVAAAATVVDDPLDTKIRVDTKNFYVQKAGLLRVTSGDKYFRAFIDRKTGQTILQLVLWQSHGGGWQFWDRAVAEGPDGPIELPGHRLDSDVSCSTYGCSYLESVAVDVDEPLLRWVAAGARPGTDETWKMKVYGRSEEGAESGILKTEAAGFLIAVDRARASLHPTTLPTPSTASPSARQNGPTSGLPE